MNDIFISYSNEDREIARLLAEKFEDHGWKVFWDRTIPTGKTWREVIGFALEYSRCIIVLWSSRSVESGWVQEEADTGLEKRNLIPILIEDARLPIGFRRIQTANLVGWAGDEEAVSFQRLVADIGSLLEADRDGEAPVNEQKSDAADLERGGSAVEAEARHVADQVEAQRATEEAEARLSDEEVESQPEAEGTDIRCTADDAGAQRATREAKARVIKNDFYSQEENQDNNEKDGIGQSNEEKFGDSVKEIEQFRNVIILSIGVLLFVLIVTILGNA